MCILGIVQWNKPETMINNTSLCCRRQERLSRHLVTVFLIMILAGNLNVALTGKKHSMFTAVAAIVIVAVAITSGIEVTAAIIL